MLITQTNPSTLQKPNNKTQRRAFIGGAMAALLSSPRRAMAQGAHVPPGNPFIVLLKGVYQPVPAGQGPANNLGLTTVKLNDGSFSRTPILPVFWMSVSRERGPVI